MIPFIIMYFFVIGENDISPLQDKKSLKLGPKGNLFLERFALNVIAKANEKDHAGRANFFNMVL